jgi:hypothetical protein
VKMCANQAVQFVNWKNKFGLGEFVGKQKNGA